MSTLLLTSLDFNHLELLNVRFQNLASDPSSPSKGWTYFNTSTNKPRWYNGTTWDELGSGGGTVTSVSVASSNGFAGTVTGTTALTVTLSTSVTGMVKGNGTAISAATSGTDYSAGTSALATGILKSTTTTGALTIAAAADIPSVLTTKGDLAGYATAPVRVSVGSNKNVLNADSTNANGVAWVAMDHTWISDFDTQVRSSTLNQMTAPTADLSINTHKLTNVVDPSNPQDAATKNYVDALSQGLDFKSSVVVATTANGTLATAYANGQTVDGVVLATGNRILLKNQTTASDNGIYTVNATGAPTRATDADASGEISKGTLMYVESGTANAGELWLCSATGATPWVPGSSTSTWTQFAGAADITATAPITKTGNAIGIGIGAGLTTSGGNIVPDTTVLVRKYAATIGDGSSTSIAVTHSLGTQDITVSVRDASTNALVMCDVTATSTSVATFVFAVAPGSSAYKVVIHG